MVLTAWIPRPWMTQMRWCSINCFQKYPCDARPQRYLFFQDCPLTSPKPGMILDLRSALKSMSLPNSGSFPLSIVHCYQAWSIMRQVWAILSAYGEVSVMKETRPPHYYFHSLHLIANNNNDQHVSQSSTPQKGIFIFNEKRKDFYTTAHFENLFQTKEESRRGKKWTNCLTQSGEKMH